MFVLPLAVIAASRIGAELSVRVLPIKWAWIPALFIYYLSIEGAVLFVRRVIPEARAGLAFNAGSPAATRSIVLGIVVPALLPLGFFILNVSIVPVGVLVVIPVFAVVNAYFEEVFWRGQMAYLPASNRVRILYSGSLFALSHWLFMGAYWLSRPRVLIPVMITTFIMGMAWMWFYLRERSLGYTIASHIVVDVLNLSVAMFMGLQLRTV